MHRLRALLFLACLLVLPAGAAHAGSGKATLTGPHGVDLAGAGMLYQGGPEGFPASADELPGWLSGLRGADKVDLLGGSYWLYVQLRNDTRTADWVFDPNDTLIELVEARLIGSDGSVRDLRTGYRAPHEYLLHYGKDIRLAPGTTYHVLVRFSSVYYARAPVFSVVPADAYRKLVASENVQIIGALGALLALGIFNFFLYSFTRERASLYYALYVLAYAVAWALTFHLGADLFDWHALEWHYVPFFLLPIFSTLFYMHFLRLRERAPTLHAVSRVNLMLPLLALPSCFLAPAYAHALATIVISIWMTLALACGIVSWVRGYQPARFFVFAFIALMLPGLFILPANLGLTPALVANAQLLTLIGGTIDGILLAFALADQIRLLRNRLEESVATRTAELTRANTELTLAKEHAEVVSRHRIDFLSAMSHDIRTPLAGVIGMLKFALRDRTVRGPTQEYLRIGLHNGESLLAILNDILDFSKIDAGKLVLERVDLCLPTLIEDAAGVLHGHADAKSLLLRCDIAPDLPKFVVGDPTRIRQVLINLLGNAIKFTERGEVRLTASVESPGKGGAMVVLTVSDTGPGIAPDIQARLFQKFEQADHSTTRRYGGTGLGLAICKELVGLMGGTISVTSELGQGARFVVRLPLALGVPPLAQPDAARRRERHTHRLRVLCAEDVRTNQIIIGTLLEAMGHDITVVENGLEALDALAGADFDLVLMDGRMPVMDGEQAARMVRKGGGGHAPVRDPRIPIIALTANASDHDCTRYLAAGMDAYLSKPVDEAKLFDRIEDTIGLLLERGKDLRPAAPGHPLPDNELALAAQFGIEVDEEDAAAAAPVRVLALPGLSRKHMDRITQAFLEEAPRRLELTRTALRVGDAHAAAAALHALKGSSGYLSSSDLHGLALRLETLADGGMLDEVARQLPQLAETLERACADLRASQVPTTG